MAEFSPGNEQGARQAIVVALVLAAGALVSVLSTDWPDREASLPEPEPAVRPEPPTAGLIADPAQAPAAPEPALTLPDTAVAPVLPSAPAQVAPAFDLIRVEPDGAAIIAGSAEPGARVHVQLDGVDVSITQADAEGNFVALADLGRAEAPRLVTLLSEMGAEIVVSTESAIIEPVTAAPQMAEAPEAPEPARSAAENPVATPASPDALAQPGPQPEPQTAVQAAQQPEPQPEPQTAVPAAPVARVPQSAPPPGASAISRAAAEQRAPAPPPAVAGALAPSQTPSAPPSTVAPELPAAMVGLPDAAAPRAPQRDTLSAFPSPVAQTRAPVAAPEPAAEEDVEPAPARTPDAEPSVSAPPRRVMIASSDGITIVQDGARRPDAMQNVTLDTITYDAAGEVQLTGRGRATSTVRLYLDNRPVLSAPIAEDGQWRTALPEVEGGVYTLRVDELGADGSVTSRIETPFQRESVAELDAAAAQARASAPDGAAPVRLITVQPDTTLWGIARDTYGNGMLFVRVFEANRDKIRDPHWIYPGQVFTLPE